MDRIFMLTKMHLIDPNLMLKVEFENPWPMSTLTIGQIVSSGAGKVGVRDALKAGAC